MLFCSQEESHFPFFYLDTNVRMICVSLNSLAKVLIEITEGLPAVRREIKLPGWIFF